jgi:hypothetical protein
MSSHFLKIYKFVTEEGIGFIYNSETAKKSINSGLRTAENDNIPEHDRECGLLPSTLE